MGKKRRREERQAQKDAAKKAKKDQDGGAATNGKKQDSDTSSAAQQADLSRLQQVNAASKRESRRLIVVLEEASLETVKWGKGFGLLNVDDHSGILRKHGRDLTSARPDIAHQCLLSLLDSPLNRAGLLQVFIRTKNNVLVEINPQTRIPRTFPRFAGLMVQLLHKFSIRAADSSVKLLKVIKNPVTDHIPVGCKKILMSYSSKRIVKASDLVPSDPSESLCVVIGAIAKGAVESADYTEEDACIGNYPLSAALTCAKITNAFEDAWGVF